MTVGTYFSQAEKACIRRTFPWAESLMESHFKLRRPFWSTHLYDVRTRSHLQQDEVQEGAFAHLCRYARQERGQSEPVDEAHFYRVCLQDGHILDALQRGSSFIRFAPLMLYIATHELIHIVRFALGECDFDMPRERRIQEEEEVHALTRTILKPMSALGIDLVLECFSNDYRIGEASFVAAKEAS